MFKVSACDSKKYSGQQCAKALQPTVGYCCRQGINCCVRPQPLLNKVIKVKDNKQKPKDACPARTEADSEPQPKITTSCPACSNTFVGGRL